MRGIIVKAIAGFYYVAIGEKNYACKARGIFKKEKVTPYVGDEVIFEVTHAADEEGVINEILPRKNQFMRPPIANVDCFLVVVALSQPKTNLFILDRFLVMAEKARTDIVICLNKLDLATDKEVNEIREIYRNIYPVVCISSLTGEGIEELKTYLPGKKSALAGPSGVGKSSILNNLQLNFDAEIGAVSRKTKRGKNTTRHVELFSLDVGGMVYDTPGFTSFDILDAEEDELEFFYPEISKLAENCKFDDCRHIKEPGCAVREGALKGEISKSRYESFITQMTEIKEKEKNKY